MNDPPPSSHRPLPGHALSPLLAEAGFRHAFFDRTGGASLGPFHSLSFSTAVGDDPEHVAENLRRAGSLLGVQEERLLYLSQVHGSRVHFFHEPRTREQTITLEGDALGGSDPNAGYGVRSADCVPILVADQQSGWVMAIHAGWRGVVARVIEAAISQLRQKLGGRGQLLAAVGPHISVAAFEVSEEVATQLTAASPDPEGVVDRSAPRPHVNLSRIVRRQLLALGLGAEAIDEVGGCTVLEPQRYFSFRRDGKVSGRHLSLIVPNPR